ncbi:hypothetical protein QBC47DRAFT_380078 [Echria macrotheca]|uniref:Uncharacterized protein n=1 Tax=Echria macrotheca TaxID=438768 RepID=A0AAJ0FCI4_9PEZI|nr:hypothetical protein QBC47DRAFT_380078 [Echria macrotheca]
MASLSLPNGAPEGPRRRMYLFRSTLSLFQCSNAASTSGSGPQPHDITRWEETTDLSQIYSIPQILWPCFDIKCHIGVIIIADKICADTSMSLAQKLLAGRVFEHAGPSMRTGREAVGRGLDMKGLNGITGLEFVGWTARQDRELDGYLQQLVSAGRDINSKPPYNPIFWNCHDISCRFVRAVVTEDSDLAPLCDITAAFERAKFNVRMTVEVVVGTAENFLLNAVASMAGLGFPHAALWLYNKAVGIHARHVMWRQGVLLRRTCLAELEGQFPGLRELRVIEGEWDAFVKSIPALYPPL